MRHALVLACFSLATIAVTGDSLADSPPSGVLGARLTLRSDKGHVGCTLYDSARGFPTDPSAAKQLKWCTIENHVSLCSFDPIPAGTYALACFHDENDNKKLDTGLFGIPTEGTVVSRRAKGVMGPPSFDDAKIAFSGRDTTLDLPMDY